MAKSPSLSPESKKRFSDSVEILLDSDTGRRKFRKFLTTRNLSSEVCVLDLWEECNKLLSRSRRTHKVTKDKCKKIIDFIEEEDVNLDIGQIRCLRSKVNRGLYREMINETKEHAYNLLDCGYRTFCTAVLMQ